MVVVVLRSNAAAFPPFSVAAAASAGFELAKAGAKFVWLKREAMQADAQSRVDFRVEQSEQPMHR